MVQDLLAKMLANVTACHCLMVRLAQLLGPLAKRARSRGGKTTSNPLTGGRAVLHVRRHRELKDGAPRHIRRCPQSAPVRLYDAAAYGKPHP